MKDPYRQPFLTSIEIGLIVSTIAVAALVWVLSQW